MEAPAEPDSGGARQKQAACVLCHSKKLKCNRAPGEGKCERCQQTQAECIIRNHPLGRQKGVKNKRKGVEKALHQIEQAIKKSKIDQKRSGNVTQVITNLQQLLTEAQQQMIRGESNDPSEDRERPRSFLDSQQIAGEDSLTLDDAENPLQLLARASDLQLSPRGIQTSLASPLPISSPGTAVNSYSAPSGASTGAFFVPLKAHLDVGTDLDPVDLGLVTMEEASMLFTYFYDNLSHTRWGLDPAIHTLPFVRSQSAFLFTSILSASALFIPSASALSKRLSAQVKALAQRIIINRHRSVEIVLAFMVNVPWMAPGKRLGDDDTCLYIAVALNIALDLSLNKITTLSTTLDGRKLARADCIDPKRALLMDGFDDVDPAQDLGRRLLRRRERAWIALFVVERGVCLARGRSYSVPLTCLIEHCDHWHISSIANSRDGQMNSMAVLRRDLDDLFRQVRHACDNYQATDPGIEAAQFIRNIIEKFYDRWYATWPFSIGEGKSRSLPPYVEILVTHTLLSTYSGVINHPTAPLEVKQFFRAAALSSALNVMRAAIQGESRLKSMPNNTVIMIAFAACSALSLSTTSADSRPTLAPSVRNLIKETADVLERIGITPAHRNGASVLYGRFLRELVSHVSGFSGFSSYQTEKHPRQGVCSDSLSSVPVAPNYNITSPQARTPFHPSISSHEPLQFSTMSGDQIADAVNRAENTLGISMLDFPLDDMMSWEWFDFANQGEFPL